MGQARELQPAEQLQAEELLQAIAAAEAVIVTAIERECEALRAGQMLAAKALHTRFCDAARLYLDATRAARVSIEAVEASFPGTLARLEDGRSAFSAVLKVELAVLATERAAVEARARTDFSGRKLENHSKGPQPPPSQSGGRSLGPQLFAVPAQRFRP